MSICRRLAQVLLAVLIAAAASAALAAQQQPNFRTGTEIVSLFVTVADAQGRLKDADLGVPGHYSLRDSAGHEVRRLSVNSPAQESNLESLRPGDFLQQLTRIQEKPKETLAAGLFGLHNDQHEFWTVLLLAALVLVLVEPFIANRTSV